MPPETGVPSSLALFPAPVVPNPASPRRDPPDRAALVGKPGLVVCRCPDRAAGRHQRHMVGWRERCGEQSPDHRGTQTRPGRHAVDPGHRAPSRRHPADGAGDGRDSLTSPWLGRVTRIIRVDAPMTDRFRSADPRGRAEAPSGREESTAGAISAGGSAGVISGRLSVPGVPFLHAGGAALGRPPESGQHGADPDPAAANLTTSQARRPSSSLVSARWPAV